MLFLPKNGFVQTIMAGVAWLTASLVCSPLCAAGVSGTNTLVQSSHPVSVSAPDLKYGEGTVCSLLPDQGLYQCDPTGNDPVRVQFETRQPVWLGLEPKANTVIANHSEERAIAYELRGAYQRGKEIEDKARKLRLNFANRAHLTRVDLKAALEEEQDEKLDKKQDEKPGYHYTIDISDDWWPLVNESEGDETNVKRDDDNQGDSLARTQDIIIKNNHILLGKGKHARLTNITAVVLTPTPSTEKGESEVKQEVKEEPDPEATGSDHVEGNQDQGRPEGSQPVQTGIVDLENSTIKEALADEQNTSETAISDLLPELWDTISDYLPMNDIGHLAIAKKLLSTLFNTPKKLEILSRRYYGHAPEAYIKISENMDLPAVPNADPNNEIKDRLWRLAYHRYKSNKHLRSLENNTRQLRVATLSGHDDLVSSVTELADGRLASGSLDNTVKVWNLNKPHGKQCVATLTGHTDTVVSITELAHGRLASGSDDYTVKVWDLDMRQCVATLTGHDSHVFAVTQLADGRLASGSVDKTVKVWDLKPGREQCVATLTGHDGYVFAVTQLADGRLASGSYDNTVKVWDLKPGREQCVATLTGHDGYVFAVTQLADGRLASGSSDRTVKVWDLSKPEEQQCVATLYGHHDYVHSVTKMADGRLASGSFDKTVKVWDLSKGLPAPPSLKRKGSSSFSVDFIQKKIKKDS